LSAKKKKKNKPPKKGGFAWASSFTLQPFEASATRQLADTAVASFQGRAGGQPLCEELVEASDIPKALWNAPLACLIMAAPAGPISTGSAEEEAVVSDAAATTSVVKYANIAALETVGLAPEEFEQLFATGPPQQGGDASVETTISLQLPCIMKGAKKFERGYQKKMLKREAGDVTILDASRWDLEQSQIVNGKFVTQSLGVAYAWTEWMVGSETLCKPGGHRKTLLTKGDDYEARIAQQGAFIRDLKENQGMGNKDPQVVAAVAELLRLKKVQGEQQE
jgi:hypothetical protein